MLHDIAPHQFNNQYRPQPPTAESYVLCFDKNTVLLRRSWGETFDLPTFAELAVASATDSPPTYLFSIDGGAFYLSDGINAPENFTWQLVSETMKSGPRHLAFAVVTGYQLHR